MNPACRVQEVGAYKLAVKPERRRQFSGELVTAAPQVFSMLATCHACAPSDPNLTNAVWGALACSSMLLPAFALRTLTPLGCSSTLLHEKHCAPEDREYPMDCMQTSNAVMPLRNQSKRRCRPD